MHFTSLVNTLSFAAVSFTALVSGQPTGTAGQFHYANVYGGKDGTGINFRAQLADNSFQYLTVFHDKIVLSPRLPEIAPWWFKKVTKDEILDLLSFEPKGEIGPEFRGTYVPTTKQFELRDTDELAKGYFNLTPFPQFLKFDDKIDFKACKSGLPEDKAVFKSLYRVLLKGTTAEQSADPAWALPGSCQNIKIACMNC